MGTHPWRRTQDIGDSLKLPEDVTIFEDRDPNLHKPTAVVNGQIITKTDVDQRLALLSFWRMAARCLMRNWHACACRFCAT
jgi:hypothetical protein